MKDHYQKVSTHVIFMNKKHHYKNIIQAKKSINFRQIQRDLDHFTLPQTNYKYQSFKDRQIKKNNQIMMQKIQSIKKRARIKTMPEYDDKEKSIERYFPNRHLYQFEKKTYEDNLKLIKRLGMIKPVVGSQQEWQKHFNKSKKLQKQIKKHSMNKHQSQQKQLKQAITEITRRQLKKQKKRQSVISSQIMSEIQNKYKQRSKPTAQTKYSIDQNLSNQFMDLSLSKSNQREINLKQQARQLTKPKTQKSQKTKKSKHFKKDSQKKNCQTYREGIYKIILKDGQNKQIVIQEGSRCESVKLQEDQNFQLQNKQQNGQGKIQNL